MGVVCPLGCGLKETLDALTKANCGLGAIRLFPVLVKQKLPVGAVDLKNDDSGLPRTHRLARLATDQALADSDRAPDAIVLGSTTGGILATESLFEEKDGDPEHYRWHALGSVGEDLAACCGCTGPVITVSTACSSGAVAIKLAMEMLRCGLARRVLAGGADSLCRLTYFGFNSLQLIDPAGAHPLDRERRGMSVGEGAAMLLLTTEQAQTHRLQLSGAGLSCDAHHATTPHPEGEGALAAMRAALADAGISAADIDYINLHGTGTPDNDLSEARAVRTLYPTDRPPVSSTKGATGHTLAAAGAIEAVISGLCIEQGMVAANVGFETLDPALNITPVTEPAPKAVATVMSNSFGFGGNNAAVIVGRSQRSDIQEDAGDVPGMTIVGKACLSGAGHTEETYRAFSSGGGCRGLLDNGPLSEGLPPRLIRRLKRLPQMALSMAVRTCDGVPREQMPAMVSMGTAWGALSETHDFLERLIETGQQYPSPTDFIGSVHNAPAGQIAMLLGAKGANVTTSGGDCSFEQALRSADLLTRDSADAILVVGADEYHAHFSPLFDASVRLGGAPADGGAGLLLQRGEALAGPTISLPYHRSGRDRDAAAKLIASLGGRDAIDRSVGAILVGIPAAMRGEAEVQLGAFMAQSRYKGPVIDYRRGIGEFGSASAVASALGAEMAERGVVPAGLTGDADHQLRGRGVLVLGLGAYLTAVRIMPS